MYESMYIVHCNVVTLSIGKYTYCAYVCIVHTGIAGHILQFHFKTISGRLVFGTNNDKLDSNVLSLFDLDLISREADFGWI